MPRILPYIPKLLLSLLLTLCFQQATAQKVPDNVTGIWLGKLTQEVVAPFSDFRFRMELEQHGTEVTGFSYISLPDSSDLYAKMELSGTFRNGLLEFEEQNVVSYNQISDYLWCLKNGQLDISVDRDFVRLEGPWDGFAGLTECKPGRIELERLNPNPVIGRATAGTAKPPVPKEVEKPKEPNYGDLLGRNITRQRDIVVQQKQLTVHVYDADKVDGDVVSLQWNGKWLLQHYPLSKQYKSITLNVEDGGDNRLILYAENEGKYPPNTAALSFFDGQKKRFLNLKSDKATCGALHFLLK